jgi:hypothetical protein
VETASKSDPELRSKWLEWVDKHNALLPEYDKIKSDQTLDKFHRPANSADFGFPVKVEGQL